MKLPHVRAIPAVTLAVTAMLIPVTLHAASANVPASPTRTASQHPDPTTYGITLQERVPVTMDDGVRLNATVGRPTDLATGELAEGRFPVILQQSPYSTGIASFFVEHGYIVVNVNPRGTQLSEGTIGWLSPRDTSDGKLLVDWAAHELPGSNGKVGLFGCSYHGVNQVLTAATLSRNSPVKAIIPACTWGDAYSEAFFSGGVPTQTIPAMPASFALAFGGHPATIDFFNQFYSEIDAGGPRAYQGTFWNDRELTHLAPSIVRNNIPTLLWTGWDDVVEGGALDLYVALQNSAAGRSIQAPMPSDASADPRFQIVVGPWRHGQGLDNSVMLAWYDQYLRGVRSPFASSDSVHLYEVGADRWVDTEAYPIDRRYESLYLADGNALSSKRARREGGAAVTYTQPDQASGRASFLTSPIRREQTLAGPVSATLFAQSSNSQAHLIVDLNEVKADGTRVHITTGNVLGSLRAIDPSTSWVERGSDIVRRPRALLSRDSYLRPGKTYRFDIALSPRTWRLTPGSRLELSVSTQFKGCTVTLETDPCNPTLPQRTSLAGGSYRIIWSKQFPSAVNLPMVGPASLRESGPMISGLTP